MGGVGEDGEAGEKVGGVGEDGEVGDVVDVVE